MSQSTSLIDYIVLFLSVPVRLFLTVTEVSIKQALGKLPTGTWSQNMGEASLLCYVTRWSVAPIHDSSATASARIYLCQSFEARLGRN
jgi:hypothetical protein